MSDLCSPENLRASSNLIHAVEGAGLSAAGLLALAQVKTAARWLRWTWPAVFCLIGFADLGLVLFWWGVTNASQTWACVKFVPQQIQHLALAAVLFVAGAYEMISYAGEHVKTCRYAAGILLVITGALFWIPLKNVPDPAATYSLLFHRALGAVLALAGLFKFGYSLSPKASRGYCWCFFLLVAGFLLIGYREPPGAYEKRRVRLTSEDLRDLTQPPGGPAR